MLDFKSAPKKNLVEDHPMNISGKFGSILFSGFREDLNVKKKKANGRTLTHDKSSHGLWPGELKIPIFDKSSSMILILLKLINLKIINSSHNSSIYVQVTQDA